MAIGRRTSSKIKNLRYIEVDGVPNKYLDAALMCACSYEFTIDLIQTESKLLSKIKVTSHDLKQNKYDHKQLIQLISEHLLESYTLFNAFGNISSRLAESIIKEAVGSGYKRFSQEEWEVELKKLIPKQDMSIFNIINFLRFYKGGEFKGLISNLLEEKEAVSKFYQETNMKINSFNFPVANVVTDDFDLPWTKVNENITVDDSDLPWNKVVDNSVGQNASIKQNSSKQVIDKKLITAIEILNELRVEVQSYEDVKSIKETLEQEKIKNKELTSNLKKVAQESKAFETRSKSLLKENLLLKKSNDSQKMKVEQYQKETGRLGSTLGEIRQEKEEIEKSNMILNKQIAVNVKNEKTALRKLERDLKKEHTNDLARVKTSFEKKLEEYESQIKVITTSMEKEQEKNRELREEMINVKQQSDQMELNMQIVLNERDELLKEVDQSSIGVKNVEVPEDDDLSNFEFNAADLEDFIEFDNKPKKN